MTHSKRKVGMTVIGLFLSAALALAASLPAGPASNEEGEATICEKALLNCLSDVANVPMGVWTAGLNLAFCLSGNEFCKKYVAPYL